MSLLHSLIAQAKHPKGFVGRTMLKIMNAAHGSMMLWGLSKINWGDNAVILDIGCGGGKTIQLLSDRVAKGKIFGIDSSRDAVEACVKANRADVRSGKVTVKRASVSAIPFSENFFDVITAFQTHYFWPDLANDVREVNRVLKPQGQFVLVSELYKINYHMQAYKTIESLKALLLQSGFSSVRVFETRQAVCFVCVK